MAKIIIYRYPKGYVADFGESEFGKDVEEAFGDTVLPLPYTAEAPVSDVLRDVEESNPWDHTEYVDMV